MKTVKDKICPKCNSKNVIDANNRGSDAGNMGHNGSYGTPTMPIFKCNDCGETFYYVK